MRCVEVACSICLPCATLRSCATRLLRAPHDKPLLLFKDGQVLACGNPWQGKEHYGRNEILPLEAVSILQRGTTNCIERISPKAAFETLLSQCHVPDGRGNFAAVAGLVQQLSSVRLYRLSCNMEDEAAKVSYQTLVGR